MSSQQSVNSPLRSKKPIRAALLPVIVVGLAAMMAIDTTVVRIGSEQDLRQAEFSPQAFGQREFPRIQAWIEEHAVSASVLLSELNEDRDAAAQEYGVKGGIAPVFPVTFKGVVGEGRTGIYSVEVDSLPDDMLVRVQMGPAINGTELRDATGTIKFGQFTNQIEYQDAGQAINDVMKEEVLSNIDTESLEGAEILVTGAFTLLNPESWLVTPVRVEML